MKGNRRSFGFILFLILLLLSSCEWFADEEATVDIPSSENGQSGNRREDTQDVINITWCIPQLEIESYVEEEFNQYLKEDHIPAQVSFRSYSRQELEEGSDFFSEGVDIITFFEESSQQDNYRTAAENEWIISLEDLLCLEESDCLKKAYPEGVWEGARVNGEIYGVMNPSLNTRAYLVFHQELLEQYGITMNVDRSWEEILAIIGDICENEWKAGNSEIIGLRAFPLYGPEGIERLETGTGIGVFEEDGRLRAEFYIHIPEWEELRNIVGQSSLRGYIGTGSGPLTEKNFLCMLQYSYSAKAAEKAAREKTVVFDNLQTVAYNENMTFRAIPAPACIQNPYRGYGIKTGITSAGNKDVAFEVLKKAYSEEKYSELLAYGVTNNKNEEESIFYIEQNYAKILGNPFILRPLSDENIQKRDILREIFEGENSVLCGFHFNPATVQEEWDNNRRIYQEHAGYFMGNSKEPEKEKEQLEILYQNAGADKLLNEINRQLAEFEKK